MNFGDVVAIKELQASLANGVMERFLTIRLLAVV